MAARDDGSFDRSFLLGSTAIQYVAWVIGTVLGAVVGSAIGDTDRFGLDAVYPTFFLVLLIHELRPGRRRHVAAGGALIALALIPFAPAGVPVLAASAAALVGLRTRAGGEEAARFEGGEAGRSDGAVREPEDGMDRPSPGDDAGTDPEPPPTTGSAA